MGQGTNQASTSGPGSLLSRLSQAVQWDVHHFPVAVLAAAGAGAALLLVCLFAVSRPEASAHMAMYSFRSTLRVRSVPLTTAEPNADTHVPVIHMAHKNGSSAGEDGSGGAAAAASLDDISCPLRFDRLEYVAIREGTVKPYLLGGQQRPHCTNCRSQRAWSTFCKFEFKQFYGAEGPICPPWTQRVLLGDLISKAERGVPGAREMLELTPCDLWPYLRGHTLWFVGDSMMQEYMKGMMCFFSEFWDVEQWPEPPIKPHPAPGTPEFPGWCVDMPGSTRLCMLRANMGEQVVDNVLSRAVQLGMKNDDVLLVNFAVWHNTYEEYHGNMSRWYQFYAANKQWLPYTLWRDSSVQHFDTVTGDYIWPPRSGACVPLRSIGLTDRNELIFWDTEMTQMAQGGWRNIMAYPVMAQLGIPVIHTWNVSLGMWNYHVNYREEPGDCTHMCHPSATQFWIYALYDTLRGLDRFKHITTKIQSVAAATPHTSPDYGTD